MGVQNRVSERVRKLAAEVKDGTLEVILIEDQREIREGLGILIGGTPGFRIAGSYPTMEEALKGSVSGPPQVALSTLDFRGCPVFREFLY